MDFVKYVQLVVPALVLGKRYYFEVVGSTFLSNGVLQLVFKLRDADGCESLLLQEFDEKSEAFDDLVHWVYDVELSTARVAEVKASDFLCWHGCCSLCTCSDGALAFDLTTVEDFELPLSALYEA